MTAKSFCYACAGIFLLVAAWTTGARHARADFDSVEFPIVGVTWDENVVLRADGTVWECPLTEQWQQIEGYQLPTGVSVSDIAFWDGNKLVTKSGVLWISDNIGPSAWISCGPLPPPTVSVESSTWSGVKDRFRK